MECSHCQSQMKVENQSKENGFWFLWYKCPECAESYLHKSPYREEKKPAEENSTPDSIHQK